MLEHWLRERMETSGGIYLQFNRFRAPIKASLNLSTYLMDPIDHFIRVSFHIFRSAGDDIVLLEELMGGFGRHGMSWTQLALDRLRQQLWHASYLLELMHRYTWGQLFKSNDSIIIVQQYYYNIS